MYFKAFSIIFITLIFTVCATKETLVPEPPVPVTAPVEIPPEEPIRPLVDMVFVAGGSFSMGSPRGTPRNSGDEYPVHTVTLRDFYMGVFEITWEQYSEITGIMKPCPVDSGLDGRLDSASLNFPLEMVSWYEALVFCNRLSIRENLNPVYRINGSTNPDDWGYIPVTNNAVWDQVEMIAGANGYRLPTEAEWEYAARGGSPSRNFEFAGSNNPDEVAWHFNNSDFMIHEVGGRSPNDLGLFDMSGNVMEWCWDWHGRYGIGPKDNPTGQQTGRFRIIRGGAWSLRADFSRVAYRHRNEPFYKAVNLGFRVARWP